MSFLTKTHPPPDAMYSECSFPVWSPDGKKIVFASKPWGGDNQRADFHLWILNQVEETNQ
ncbi:MAG: hypothetical protein GTO24_05635 [candidate division Zixibacteria bacterium]|nr:hypothetical protein [candidate division Zixibacteria bacterium]